MAATTLHTQQEIRLKSRPEGLPSEANFEFHEGAAPVPEAGEFLVRNEYISVDPYMRGRMRDSKSYVPPFQIGEPLEGGCVGEVIESRHDSFSPGDFVVGNQGWRKYWCSDGEGVLKVDPHLAPLASYLSVLGMTGMTAYVGLLKIGDLQRHDTVFVSAASGAVGSVACQIAKIHQCRVIGSAGSPEKIDWLKGQAGVDEAFNYHAVDNISEKLSELCPEGIDVYFDNVGGDHLEAALDNMKNFGRIVCCGMISTYNDSSPAPGPRNLFKIIGQRIRMQGFIVRDHDDLLEQFQRDMSSWIKSNQIVWEETITEGLENAPAAFINLFKGEKLGKALVRV